jgi:hypothetical protein
MEWQPVFLPKTDGFHQKKLEMTHRLPYVELPRKKSWSSDEASWLILAS